jgi:hypothetical protein
MSQSCNLYVITYTQRVARGVWESHDDLRITGYSEPQEFKRHVIAPNKELAEAWWREQAQYAGTASALTFKSIEMLESTVPIISVL